MPDRVPSDAAGGQAASTGASVAGTPSGRSAWTGLTDAELLRQCKLDTYRASGPGGQKRNKTSSAVRIRHPPSGLIVIAEESRSQHENRARALRRLRQALYLHVRDPLEPALLAPQNWWPAFFRDARADGRLRLGRKDPRYWPIVGLALDVLLAVEARLSEAARALGLSTANLVRFLRADPRAWQEANALRARFGRKQLVD
jgi:hypothetical protein